jgi:[NiFe] hydrogenase diaphorase moiety large subunit
MARMKNQIKIIAEKYSGDRTRLMDMFWDIQDANGYIPHKALRILEQSLSISTADLRETLSFYHFFHETPSGKYNIYLNKDVASQLKGHESIYAAFEAECNCKFGGVSQDGVFGLFETPCIGLSDQEPAALINLVPFTNLTPQKVKDIVAALRAGNKLAALVEQFGYGDGANKQIKTMVCSNIRQLGPVFGEQISVGDGLAKALTTTPETVIDEVKTSGLRGRGGAGFGTGMKWSFCRAAKGDTKYVVCNADEGEPGTFKDRIVMTEYPEQLFEGMAIAGYAIGAQQGILYLRAEYRYMQDYLEGKLKDLRIRNILGQNVLGKSGFNFDIRIQFGAGAYVCGEESALIESMEGKRGTPRVKPPFPVTVGYLGCPTAVNNVETLAALPHILKNGGSWYKTFGTEKTPGTKLLSVSGDCDKPGVYEIEFGMTIKDFLAMVGAKDAYAVQVSGPSGECINAQQSLNRKLCHEDLSAGGSMIVFNKDRDLLKYMRYFMTFFVEESCGACVPCRAGNIVMRNNLDKIRAGHANQEDLDNIFAWGQIVADTSRCGLGATSRNPIVSSFKNFPELYKKLLDEKANPLYDATFNLEASVEDFDRALKEQNQIGRNVHA